MLRLPHFAGEERGSRLSQIALNLHCDRVRATEHAPRGPFYVLERRHGLAVLVERGVGVQVERQRVNPSNTSWRVVGQWGGAGGAICEYHLSG